MSNMEKTVLKKAGIIVAVAAAGVLAVSPLAFAGEKGDSGHGRDHGHGDKHYSKTVNNTATTTTKNSPSCSFGNASDARTAPQTASGVASPLVGILGVAANAAAPVTTQLNAPIASCNNFSDLVDLNSNNKTKTVDNSKDVDSSTSILSGLLG